MLTEFNRILWKGQFTEEIIKSTGIKQGCKISPELFIYILHEAVKRTKIECALRGITLCTGAKEDKLQLPLLLSYADDCYLICDNINQGIMVSEIFSEQLSMFGLTYNYEKSGILIKGLLSNAPASLLINCRPVPVVKSLRILGTTVNSDMNRKASLKPRLNNLMKIFHTLPPYLKELRAPMELLVKLYETILVPSMIYRLKSASMTK